MEDILDIRSLDADGGRVRRRLLRIVVPIACVALLVATVLGIVLFNYARNRKDALALSKDLLRSLDLQIANEVRTFLSPAADMVRILDGRPRRQTDRPATG
jgi:uncharacterized membrane protein affecting hemolysin expression